MSKPSARSPYATAWTWVASIGLHVGLIGGFGWLALRSMEHERDLARAAGGASETIAIELPGVAEGSLVEDRTQDPTGDPPKYTGGAPNAQLDQAIRGRGGDPTTDSPATNLNDRDERIHLTQDLIDRLDRDQQQRLKTSKERASREDRRSSKEPMELTFLASGDGARAERRTPSERDPSRGAARSGAASVRGGLVGDTERSDDAVGDLESRTHAGSERDGSRASAPGAGVHDGRAGLDHRAAAHVTRARPDVVLAAVSVPATRRGRPRDDVDSDQEVATTVRSLVHASTAGGAIGEGRGGSGGGGEAGAGGRSGAGASSRPAGPGDSEWWDLETNDPHLMPYFRRIHQKLDPLWAHAFPLRAALDFRQGTVIFAVKIAGSGDVTIGWPPARPSGIPEFDRNCYDAIRRAAPFDPIPASLGVTELHVRMPFDAQNAVVK